MRKLPGHVWDAIAAGIFASFAVAGLAMGYWGMIVGGAMGVLGFGIKAAVLGKRYHARDYRL